MFDFTEAQKNAINANGSLIVYAAAGSGKTAVLTQRVKRIVLDEKNPIDADKILVVTFTNAAAAEMKGRIIEAINKEVEECEKKGTLSNHILRQQMLISAANICTIDSFCSLILKENFEKIGIDPSFKIADEAKINEVSGLVIEEMVAERIANEDKDFKLVGDAIGIDSSLKEFKKVITSIYKKSRSLPTPEKWLKDTLALYKNQGNLEYWMDKVLVAAKEQLEALTERYDTYMHELDPSELYLAEGVRAQTDSFIENLSSAISNKKWDDAIAVLKSFKITVDRKIKPSSQEVYNLLRALRDDAAERVEKLKKLFEYSLQENEDIMKLEERAITSLIEFVVEYGERFRAEMLLRGAMTFDMVAGTAFSLVCEYDEQGNAKPTELGKALAERYKVVLVDEYQDNNSLQDAIFYAVSDCGKNLFMVGDAKQSIYGFRNANPENFIRYRDETPLYEKGTERARSKVVLDANFRSRKGVCDFANFLFGTIMQKDPCGMDYTSDDYMNAEGKYLPSDEPSVEIHITERDDADDSIEISANHIANYIKETMSGEPFLKDGDEGLRKAQYKDFAILIRSADKKGRGYAAALKKAGIPVSFASGGLFESSEIMALVSLLKAIDNPSDDISILAALSGPAFALSFDRIAQIRANYKADTFYGSLILANKNGEEDIKKVFEKLAQLRRKAATKPISEFVEEVVEEFFLREIVSTYNEGIRRRENIDAFLSVAADFEADSHFGLSAFLRRVDNFAESGNGKDNFQNVDNAVKIMTIHGSKGLEFPICFLAECSAKFTEKDTYGTVRMLEKEGVSINISNLRSHQKFEPLSAKVIKMAMRQNLVAEEERLLYVAVTRAKEKLILLIDGNINNQSSIENSMASITTVERKTGKLSKDSIVSAHKYSDWIIKACQLHIDAAELMNVARYGKQGTFLVKFIPKEQENESEITAGEEKLVRNADKTVVDEMISRFTYAYPYQKSVDSPTKTSVSKLLAEEHSAEYGFSRRPAVLSQSKMSAAEKGTATHKFMQYADYKKARINLEEEITRLAEWEYLSEQEAEVIDKTAISNFLSSKLCEEMLNSGLMLREQRFLVPLKDGEGETVIQGSVDCVFARDDEICIVDFKTTRFDTDEEFKNAYHKQLEIYADAMQEILGMKVSARYIYSLHLSKTIEV